MSDFHTRATALTRKSLAAKAKRDREFIALIAIHIMVIFGGAYALNEQWRAEDRTNQETLAWTR